MEKVYKNTILWGIILTTIISLASGTLLTQKAEALTYSSSTKMEFTFNPVIGVSLSSDLHIDNLAPGTAADSNIITVSVNTNTAYGYTLNATVGQETNYETRNLVLDGNNSYNFSSLDYGSSLAAITTDNTWGYSYRPSGAGASWTNYSGLPLYSDETNVANLITTEEAESDSVEFKIAAKASNGQASGTYKNVINFIAVANPEPPLGPVACEAGKICYNVNSVDPTEGTMGKQSAGDNASVTLLASNFSRQGYGFAGWNTSYDYSGINYGPNETITTPADTSTNGLSLYAIWVPSAGDIQNWSCPNNTMMPIGTVTALRDQRDNEVYAVAKLADGNCWMIENLRLENTSNDNNDGFLAQGYGVSDEYGYFFGLAEPEISWLENYTTINSLYSVNGDNGTIRIGSSNAESRFPRYNNANNQANSANRPQNPTYNNEINNSTKAGMYSYGNYYTWAAAIADTSSYNTMDQSTDSTSICPLGWRLPRGGDKTRIESGNSDFWNLLIELNAGILPENYEGNPFPVFNGGLSNRMNSYPNNFLFSGHGGSSQGYNSGFSGHYWSSTSYSNSQAFGLLYFNGEVRASAFVGKSDGGSIRCVDSLGL